MSGPRRTWAGAGPPGGEGARRGRRPGLLLAEGFNRGCPQPGYRSGYGQG
jgi:hypothetical protein